MKKNKKNEEQNQSILSLSVLDPEISSEESFYDLVFTFGLKSFLEMVEEEITGLCGPRYRHIAERMLGRWSRTESEVVFNGRKTCIPHTRVRDLKKNKDVTLKTISAAKNIDLIRNRQFENMLIGVSTRKYKRSLEEIPKGHRVRGIEKSTVSRNFVLKTRDAMHKFLNAPISEEFPILMINGITFKKRTIIVALGIGWDGHKQVLGMVCGSTENSRVCIDLLNDLEERGLRIEGLKLAVIDGSKALRKALRDKAGDGLAVQRCQEHKIRNVMSYLPEEKQLSIKYSMREAYKMADYDAAYKYLNRIVANLDKEYSSAANSLREGLEETLTLHKLNAPSSLRASLRSTNPIENLMGSIRHVTKRVKRWLSDDMVMRWAFSGIFEAHKGFRRIRGYRKLKIMLDNIGNINRKEARVA
jgi:putative transposase